MAGAPLDPQRAPVKVDHYLFRGDFDSGNLKSVLRVPGPDGAAPVYDVWILKDCEGTAGENHYRFWYHLSVAGGRAGDVLHVRIMNLNRVAKVYSQDLTPVCRSHPSESSFHPIHGSCSDETVDDCLRVSFSHRFAATGETVFFALCEPYSYGMVQSHLDQWQRAFQPSMERTLCALGREFTDAAAAAAEERRPPAEPRPPCNPWRGVPPAGNALGDVGSDPRGRPGRRREAAGTRLPPASPRASTPLDGFPISTSTPASPPPPQTYFRRELAILSGDGRRIELLTVTSWRGICARREKRPPGLFPDATPRPHLFKAKPVVFIGARVHPGETAASYMLHGVLDVLLFGRGSPADELRDRFVFKIIPLLNPDGVARGHYRSDARGQNLNRCYNNPCPSRHPSIFASMSVLRALNEERGTEGVLFFFDLHAFAVRPGCYLIGNTLTPELQAEQWLLANVASRYSPHFNLLGCAFGRAKNTQSLPSKLTKVAAAVPSSAEEGGAGPSGSSGRGSPGPRRQGKGSAVLRFLKQATRGGSSASSTPGASSDVQVTGSASPGSQLSQSEVQRELREWSASKARHVGHRESDKSGTARSAVMREFGILHTYTVECSLNRRPECGDIFNQFTEHHLCGEGAGGGGGHPRRAASSTDDADDVTPGTAEASSGTPSPPPADAPPTAGSVIPSGHGGPTTKMRPKSTAAMHYDAGRALATALAYIGQERAGARQAARRQRDALAVACERARDELHRELARIEGERESVRALLAEQERAVASEEAAARRARRRQAKARRSQSARSGLKRRAAGSRRRTSQAKHQRNKRGCGGPAHHRGSSHDSEASPTCETAEDGAHRSVDAVDEALHSSEGGSGHGDAARSAPLPTQWSVDEDVSGAAVEEHDTDEPRWGEWGRGEATEHRGDNGEGGYDSDDGEGGGYGDGEGLVNSEAAGDGSDSSEDSGNDSEAGAATGASDSLTPSGAQAPPSSDTLSAEASGDEEAGDDAPPGGNAAAADGPAARIARFRAQVSMLVNSSHFEEERVGGEMGREQAQAEEQAAPHSESEAGEKGDNSDNGRAVESRARDTIACTAKPPLAPSSLPRADAGPAWLVKAAERLAASTAATALQGKSVGAPGRRPSSQSASWRVRVLQQRLRALDRAVTTAKQRAEAAEEAATEHAGRPVESFFAASLPGSLAVIRAWARVVSGAAPLPDVPAPDLLASPHLEPLLPALGIVGERGDPVQTLARASTSASVPADPDTGGGGASSTGCRASREGSNSHSVGPPAASDLQWGDEEEEQEDELAGRGRTGHPASAPPRRAVVSGGRQLRQSAASPLSSESSTSYSEQGEGAVRGSSLSRPKRPTSAVSFGRAVNTKQLAEPARTPRAIAGGPGSRSLVRRAQTDGTPPRRAQRRRFGFPSSRRANETRWRLAPPPSQEVTQAVAAALVPRKQAPPTVGGGGPSRTRACPPSTPTAGPASSPGGEAEPYHAEGAGWEGIAGSEWQPSRGRPLKTSVPLVPRLRIGGLPRPLRPARAERADLTPGGLEAQHEASEPANAAASLALGRPQSEAVAGKAAGSAASALHHSVIQASARRRAQRSVLAVRGLLSGARAGDAGSRDLSVSGRGSGEARGAPAAAAVHHEGAHAGPGAERAPGGRRARSWRRRLRTSEARDATQEELWDLMALEGLPCEGRRSHKPKRN